METLGYNKNRLLLGAAVGFFCGMIFLWLMSDPHALGRLRGPARVLTTDFGRFVLSPMFMLACFACTWRFSVTALGHGRAIENDGRDLIVHSIWGPKRFPGSEIESVEVRRVRGQAHLIVQGGEGGLFGAKKAGIVLGLTELAPGRLPDLLASIERVRAGRAPGISPRPIAQQAAAEPGFDADQALARYLARKESSGISADPIAPRPVFGRKRV